MMAPPHLDSSEFRSKTNMEILIWNWYYQDSFHLNSDWYLLLIHNYLNGIIMDLP
jgi:hypothetical protein